MLYDQADFALLSNSFLAELPQFLDRLKFQNNKRVFLNANFVELQYNLFLLSYLAIIIRSSAQSFKIRHLTQMKSRQIVQVTCANGN
jgi:hypothetical protein